MNGYRRGTVVMLTVAVVLLVVSITWVDPWVSLLAGVLVVLLVRELLRPVDVNLPLMSFLALITIMALALAIFFDFYTVDLGYRLKEVGIAVACLATAFCIVASMVSHTKLEMNTSFAVLSSLFISLFLVTLIILNLLVFDILAGNTLIINNRWMMFVVTEISFIILGIWVVMVFLKGFIPFKSTKRWSS